MFNTYPKMAMCHIEWFEALLKSNFPEVTIVPNALSLYDFLKTLVELTLFPTNTPVNLLVYLRVG